MSVMPFSTNDQENGSLVHDKSITAMHWSTKPNLCDLATHHIPHVPQLSYSPDVAQSDFFLFPQIKNKGTKER
jgi:hypothetical protein